MQTREEMGHPFVVFEGGDGAGKSTQARLLHEHFLREGLASLHTHEPGGGLPALRALLLSPTTGHLQAITEALLFAADRSKHVVLMKAHRKLGPVISERFVDSSCAYQSASGELTWEEVAALNEPAVAGFTPDVTFVLDLGPRAALKRVGEEQDRIEAKGVGLQEKVRTSLMAHALAHPATHVVVTVGGKTPEEVHGEVLLHMQARELLPPS